VKLRQPIRLRLALWYAGSLFGLFVVSGLVVREAVAVGLEEDFEASIERNAELLRGFFRLEVQEYLSVEATLAHIAQEVVIPDRHVRFRRPDGEAFTALDPSEPEPRLVPPIRTRVSDLDPQLAPGWKIEVQASETELRHLVRHVDRWFVLGGSLGVLLAALAGWLVTGRTLRPVGTMAAAAERITPEGGERLPVEDPDDELGRLGQRFNAVLDRLDRALEQQRVFLADAAHELRTPVARMRADVDVALLPEVGAEARTETLRRLALDLRGTGETLDELLQLARADADPTLELQAGYLDDVIHEEHARWRPAAERAGVCLVLEQVEETPVLMNAEAIRRLAGILIDNALRYTPAEGRVAVRVACDGSVATLEVQDTGIGIPEDERPFVGRRFFRGTQARARAPHGSGLGLPIAHWIVDQHCGYLSFEHPSRGTLVRVELPASGVASEATESA
jgi:two-component system OmpR family sensor kinase